MERQLAGPSVEEQNTERPGDLAPRPGNLRGPRDIAVWKRKSSQQAAHKVLVYSLCIALGALVLMPMGWMLTAALKPSGDQVYTIPPEWFPTHSVSL